MIARIWRGAVRAAQGDEYARYLAQTGVVGYAATPGNRGVVVMRRRDGELERFELLSLWTDLEAIRAFAGDDLERAVFYPRDDAFLVEREERVTHSEVASAFHLAVVDHVALPVADPARSRELYAAALAPLGFAQVAQMEDGSVGFGSPGADDLWLAPGAPAAPVHIAVQAPSREAVDAFHAAALAAGARENGPPGLRPQYHDAYYAAYVLDHDGHNLEAVVHGP